MELVGLEPTTLLGAIPAWPRRCLRTIRGRPSPGCRRSQTRLPPARWRRSRGCPRTRSCGPRLVVVRPHRGGHPRFRTRTGIRRAGPAHFAERKRRYRRRLYGPAYYGTEGEVQEVQLPSADTEEIAAIEAEGRALMGEVERRGVAAVRDEADPTPARERWSPVLLLRPRIPPQAIAGWCRCSCRRWRLGDDPKTSCSTTTSSCSTVRSDADTNRGPENGPLSFAETACPTHPACRRSTILTSHLHGKLVRFDTQSPTWQSWRAVVSGGPNGRAVARCPRQREGA